MKILYASLVLLAIVIIPLAIVYFIKKRGNHGKSPLIVNFCLFFGLIAAAAVFLFSQSAEAAGTAADQLTNSSAFTTGMQYIAAALAVGLSGIGGGIAVASSASAALGALSESDEIFGKSLIYVGLAEGVALYGLLIAFMIIPT